MFSHKHLFSTSRYGEKGDRRKYEKRQLTLKALRKTIWKPATIEAS